MKRETRTFQTKLKIEQRAEGLPLLRGYAAVFDEETTIGSWFREIIRPGAFRAALSEDQDVVALIDHNPSRIIARSSAGTLKLSEDSKGLSVEIDPANTTQGRDIVESVSRGDVRGMSFAFTLRKDGATWTEGGEDDLDLREVKDVNLHDVSIVTHPAYPGTSVAARSGELEAIAAEGRETLRPKKDFNILNLDVDLKLIELSNSN